MVCDDGFIAYLNGVRIASNNAPADDPQNTALAPANAAEPIAVTPYPIADAASHLVPGENVLAVIVLNGSLGSSDLVFAAELLATELTPGPPTIASVSPVPGVVNDLREIRVTFDKPVTGVTAQQFLVNGQPSSQVSGTGSRYTFTFPQPAYGTVAIGWGTLHEIQDLGTPPQRFSISSPGSSWSYELLDPEGPSIARRQPPAGATLRHLGEIEVTFNRAVSGVDAADLRVNGIPATDLSGVGAGPYRFTLVSGAGAGEALLAAAGEADRQVHRVARRGEEAGEAVFSAEIAMWVSPKRGDAAKP